MKGYGFLSFPKYMGKSIGKNISKNLSSEYSQKLLDHTKQSATDALNTISKIGLVIKLLIKLQNSQKIYHRIIHR